MVGSGTAGSCTAAALATAVAKGGTITFDCGAGDVTIAVTQTLTLRTDVNTVLDGGGKITLDGGGTTRLLSYDSPNFRATSTVVTLQRLTLRNGKAPANDFTPRNGTSKCAWGYKDGAGGAVYLRDGILRVIDVTFLDNHAASPGPDVGGGAIYALGSLGVTVVGSRFVGNTGSNAGALGLLQSDGTIVNSVFEDNHATGEGANYVESGCPTFNHAEQGGGGGNGGAIAMDGGVAATEALLVCGTTFRGNTAGAFGGAVFRTPNVGLRDTTFRKSTIDGNTALEGGGGLYISQSSFELTDSTVSNNVVTAGTGGGVRTELGTVVSFTNVTFAGNGSTKGLGGALSHNGTGTIRNTTFANNTANGGPGYFSAAIAPGSSTNVYGCIFANNTTLEPYNPMQCWFSALPGANNVQWPRKRYGGSIDDTECVSGVTWADPALGPLQDNGGPTFTMLPAGAAVVGLASSCPATDQRGQARSGASCAAGAVEP